MRNTYYHYNTMHMWPIYFAFSSSGSFISFLMPPLVLSIHRINKKLGFFFSFSLSFCVTPPSLPPSLARVTLTINQPLVHASASVLCWVVFVVIGICRPATHVVNQIDGASCMGGIQFRDCVIEMIWGEKVAFYIVNQANGSACCFPYFAQTICNELL